MIFEKIIRIPTDRVGALIGKSGSVKNKIEERCSVILDISSDSGEVEIRTDDSQNNINPYKAVEIVTAIGRGFSPDNAFKLLKGDNSLHVIDLREFVGKSPNQIERIKGRIIGERGKARRNMENLSGTDISVYGRTVSIIGEPLKLRMAILAISSLSQGSMHGPVYNKLESFLRKQKIEKLQLWENQNVFE